MSPSGSNKKVANSLVAMSCAAVLTVYTAGYARTRSAASQFEVQDERRAAAPSPESRPPAPSAPTGATSQVASYGSRPANAPEPNLVASAEPLPAAVAVATQPVESPSPASLPVTAPAPTPLPAAEPVAAVAPPVPPPAPKAPPAAPPAPVWKDGAFTGWGTSRHGDIQAEVVIDGGRIQSATIINCQTRYSCSVIDMLPPQVPQRQSADVDYVSRATESANAFYFAVSEALSKAK